MKMIGIIIRGKHSNDHDPAYMEMHADVLLSDGSPIGYYGEGGGFSARSGMGMDGVVYDYETMRAQRPFYTELELAAQYGVISTLCVVQVDDDKARKFDEYWKNLSKPGVAKANGFSLVGNNCSSNAAAAFEYAGVIDGGIPGLDTPQNLYTQLQAKYGSSFKCHSGYVGFRRTGNQMNVQVAPAN